MYMGCLFLASHGCGAVWTYQDGKPVQVTLWLRQGSLRCTHAVVVVACEPLLVPCLYTHFIQR